MFTLHQQFGVAGLAGPAEPAPALLQLQSMVLSLGTCSTRRETPGPPGPTNVLVTDLSLHPVRAAAL